MIIPGYVTGAAARKYAEYCYREPVMRPITSIMDIDPHRLTPTQEFPRDTGMDIMSHEFNEFCRYEAQFSETKSDGLAEMMVRLVPHKYSSAKRPRIVYTARVANSNMHHKRYVEDAVAQIFS